MTAGLGFEPLLPAAWLWAAGVAALALAAAGVAARLRGAWLRAVAVAAIWAALWSPSLTLSERTPVRRAVVVVTDASGSMAAGGRAAQAEAAAGEIAAAARAAGFEVVRTRAGGRDSTRLFAALEGALAGRPWTEVAGAVLLSDGQAHDRPERVYPFPIHALLAGDPDARDAGMRLVQVPPSAPSGVALQVRVAVEGAAGPLPVTLSLDGRPVATVTAGAEPVTATVPALPAGEQWLEAAIAPPPGDLSPANDRAFARVVGVRPPLRVLLVTGAPYPGVRVWRTFLKSDPSVELVHFTILRTYASEDAAPTEEMALIEFPTRALFIDRIDDFNLIVFDRFAETDVLPDPFLRSVAERVRRGGALLVALGPEAGDGRGLLTSALAPVLPVRAAGPAREGAFRPALTTLGERHPATAPLAAEAGRWGPWLRHAPLAAAPEARVLMAGPGGAPLLTLARAGRGRTAVLASDQAWLWARGYEGGGPHGELLRRAAFWLMAEPELEEERLTASVETGRLIVRRRTLADTAETATVTPPGGVDSPLPLAPVAPGLFEASVPASAPGLWRVRQGGLTTAAASGGPVTAETRSLVSTDRVLRPVARASGGATLWLRDGLPEVRAVTRGGTAGPGWIGLNASPVWRVTGERRVPLLPPLAVAVLLSGLLLLAWWREGR